MPDDTDRTEHPATSLPTHPDWKLPWEPPSYRVDGEGKVVGAVPREPNNWGRWGRLDRLGTVNLITDAARTKALGLARTGEVVSCSIPIDEQMPVHPARPLVVHTHALTGTDLVAGASPSGPGAATRGRTTTSSCRCRAPRTGTA